jgi:hypothetical protein
MGEVVAGDALEGAAARAHDAAVRENRFESDDEVAGDAVLEAAHAAGVRGDVASHGREADAARVRWVEQTHLGDRGSQRAGDHSRLHHREAVGHVDLQDARHPVGAQDQGTCRRVRRTAQTRARPAHHHRNPGLGGQSHALGDLVGGGRRGDRPRQVPLAEAGLVVGVTGDDVRIGGEHTGGETGDQSIPVTGGGQVSGIGDVADFRHLTI